MSEMRRSRIFMKAIMISTINEDISELPGIRGSSKDEYDTPQMDFYCIAVLLPPAVVKTMAVTSTVILRPWLALGFLSTR